MSGNNLSARRRWCVAGEAHAGRDADGRPRDLVDEYRRGDGRQPPRVRQVGRHPRRQPRADAAGGRLLHRRRHRLHPVRSSVLDAGRDRAADGRV